VRGLHSSIDTLLVCAGDAPLLSELGLVTHIKPGHLVDVSAVCAMCARYICTVCVRYDTQLFFCAAGADLNSDQATSGSRKRGMSSTARARLVSAGPMRKAPRPAPAARTQRGSTRSPSRPAVVAPRRTQAARPQPAAQPDALQSAAERRIPRASACSASAPSATPSLHGTPPGMRPRGQATPTQSARACAPQAETNQARLVVRVSPDAAEADAPGVMFHATVDTEQPAASSVPPEAPTDIHATEDTAAPPSTRPASPHSGQSMSVAPTVVHSGGAPDAHPTGDVAAGATSLGPGWCAGLVSVLLRNAVLGDSSGQSASQLLTSTRPMTAAQPPQQRPTVASQEAAQLSMPPHATGRWCRATDWVCCLLQCPFGVTACHSGAGRATACPA
jgi:hypothetical protein